MTAAFELTQPALGGRYDVTVYQMGFRLGGKGASGRGQYGRIEEHGLHLWMGYYENAFRLMRECYAELGRDPRRFPIATWSDAFAPANFNAVADYSPDGRWLSWLVDFPPSPGSPGDPEPRRWTIPDYLARAAALLRTLIRTIEVRTRTAESAPEERTGFTSVPTLTADGLTAALARLLKYGALAGLGVAIEATNVLEGALRVAPVLPQSLIARFLDALDDVLRRQLGTLIEQDDAVRRLWEVIDLLLAVIRGSIRFRLALDPQGFDALDRYDSREWLKMNGASEGSINSAFIRALYDLAFAYEGGDTDRPRIAAGSALRGAMRAFFTYRGAFFWKMTAGMGDVVFAPLYEVLLRRGVRFEFFHKLAHVGLGSPSSDPHVARLEFDVQARVRSGKPYEPLVSVEGLPCWPSRPDFAQLEDGERLQHEKWDFESQWDRRRAATRVLRVGKDFDVVVLAVGGAVVPYVCRELVERDERWRDMVEHVATVPTQAFQLWMNTDMRALGWPHPAVNLSGYVEPFDTWADMTHVAPREAWRTAPRSIAYFCNVLRDAPDTPARNLATRTKAGERVATEAAARFVAGEHRRVRDHAVLFLNRDVATFWPAAVAGPSQFRWEALVQGGSKAQAKRDDGAFDSQFWVANVRPSDRYTQALPGTTKYRISPLDGTYDNLTIAGDWTNSSLNMGCVEAAVMSGRLAAHAISESPALAEIVGYDHP